VADVLGESPRASVDHVGSQLLGASASFQQTLQAIARVARFDASVLIEGETGTGKELAAHAIHYSGARCSGPFIAVNCGALPESLVESELYGHERGAFTDAKAAYEGLVTQATGGTLFLDEIETLTPKAQAVLLRFLQDRRYRAVGGRSFRVADVRVIAASNASLAELSRVGSFRQDLFYRLNVLFLQIPPLRERRGDAALLAQGFVRRFCQQYQLAEPRLNREMLRRLDEYDWPGNVRELENLVLRELLMSDAAELDLTRTLALPAAAPRGPRGFRDA